MSTALIVTIEWGQLVLMGTAGPDFNRAVKRIQEAHMPLVVRSTRVDGRRIAHSECSDVHLDQAIAAVALLRHHMQLARLIPGVVSAPFRGRQGAPHKTRPRRQLQRTIVAFDVPADTDDVGGTVAHLLHRYGYIQVGIARIGPASKDRRVVLVVVDVEDDTAEPRLREWDGEGYLPEPAGLPSAVSA